VCDEARRLTHSLAERNDRDEDELLELRVVAGPAACASGEEKAVRIAQFSTSVLRVRCSFSIVFIVMLLTYRWFKE